MVTVAEERTWLQQEEREKMKQCWTTATPTHRYRERCGRSWKEKERMEEN